ncbi:MAG: hypothetical protein K6E98_12415 [Lachnospiraceae bacterium]|nr:hypothetical protein [Lachnospiraceae bacterium]
MIDQIRTNKTLRELLIGAFVYCLLWETVLLVFTQRKLYHTIGLAAGFLVCAVLAAGMADSIDIAVDMDEKNAKAYLQRKSSLRYVIACVSIVVIEMTGIGNPLTFFAGIMGLKIGAYLQPFTHKMLNGFNNNESSDKDINSSEVK